MPTEAEHRAKYRENRRLLDGPPAFATVSEPWAATVAFYAAVHLVESLAAREGLHHTGHVGPGSRAWYLAAHPTHRVLRFPLRKLLWASSAARYESPAAFAAKHPPGTVQPVLIGTHLAAIEAHVVGVIGGPI